jgi:hypothetical protein
VTPYSLVDLQWRWRKIGPTRCTTCFQFIAINSLYMFRALICSSLGGTVYTIVGIFCVCYVGWLLVDSASCWSRYIDILRCTVNKALSWRKTYCLHQQGIQMKLNGINCSVLFIEHNLLELISTTSSLQCDSLVKSKSKMLCNMYPQTFTFRDTSPSNGTRWQMFET